MAWRSHIGMGVLVAHDFTLRHLYSTWNPWIESEFVMLPKIIRRKQPNVKLNDGEVPDG